MGYRVRASTIITGVALLAFIVALLASNIPQLPFADNIVTFSYLGVFPLFTLAGAIVSVATLVVDRSRWRFVELGVAVCLLLVLSRSEAP